jgi:hypothetical protein
MRLVSYFVLLGKPFYNADLNFVQQVHLRRQMQVYRLT